MKKQDKSSFEWLIEQFSKNGYIGLQDELQAKAMHKEEMRVTYNQGLMSNFQNFEDFYNETFNNNEQQETKYETKHRRTSKGNCRPRY